MIKVKTDEALSMLAYYMLEYPLKYAGAATAVAHFKRYYMIEPYFLNSNEFLRIIKLYIH